MGRLTEAYAYLTATPKELPKINKRVKGVYVFYSHIEPNTELKKLRRKLKLYKNKTTSCSDERNTA